MHNSIRTQQSYVNSNHSYWYQLNSFNSLVWFLRRIPQYFTWRGCLSEVPSRGRWENIRATYWARAGHSSHLRWEGHAVLGKFLPSLAQNRNNEARNALTQWRNAFLCVFCSSSKFSVTGVENSSDRWACGQPWNSRLLSVYWILWAVLSLQLLSATAILKKRENVRCFAKHLSTTCFSSVDYRY